MLLGFISMRNYSNNKSRNTTSRKNVKEEKHTFRNHQTKNKFSNPLPRQENQNK